MSEAPQRGLTSKFAGWLGADLAWIMAVTVIVASVILYFETFVDLWPRWVEENGATYTHGILIAVIAAWLVYRTRAELRDVRPVAMYWALIPALAFSGLWVVGDRGGIVTMHTAIWPLMAWLFILAATGPRVACRLAIPVGYLYFAIPVWGYANWILRDVTVWAVGLLNRLAGIPAQVFGNTVVIPQGRFEIADGCSGLHYFIVAAAIAVLAGELHRDRPRTRALLLGLALVIALISNWLRVHLIILAGYLTDMQHYLVRVDHYKFGWLVFAVAMVLFFVVLNKLPAPKERIDQGNSAGTHGAAGTVQDPRRAGWLVALAAVAALPLLTTVTHALAGSEDTSAYEPKAVSGFTGPVSGSPAWEPRFNGASAEWRVAYISASGRVLDYYGNVYLRQKQGQELISDGNSLTVAESALQGPARSGYIETATGTVPVIEAELLLGAGQRWFTIYVYDVRGTRVASERMAQVLTGLKSVWRDAPAGIRAAAAPCSEDCAVERSELAALLSAMIEEGQ